MAMKRQCIVKHADCFCGNVDEAVQDGYGFSTVYNQYMKNFPHNSSLWLPPSLVLPSESVMSGYLIRIPVDLQLPELPSKGIPIHQLHSLIRLKQVQSQSRLVLYSTQSLVIG